MWEIGKSYQDSEKEFDRTITYIEDTLEAMKDLDRVSSRFVIQGDIIGQIRRAPLGVVLSMGPFNYPLNETFTTLIPALLMGNTVIFKPPKFGVLLFRPLLEAFREAFPPGVVNTIYGSGSEIIGPLMASGEVDALAFIGTSRVADTIKQQHPKPHRLRTILGLDAKDPAILLPDADLDLAVRECLLGSLTFNGQRCTALKILFVHSSICEAFLERFSEAVSKLKVGMPWEPGVESDAAAGSEQAGISERPAAGCARAGRQDRQPERGRHDRDLLLPGGGLPGECLHAAVYRGAVRPDHPGGPVRRYRRTHALYHRVELRAAGQPVREGPGCAGAA